MLLKNQITGSPLIPKLGRSFVKVFQMIVKQIIKSITYTTFLILVFSPLGTIVYGQASAFDFYIISSSGSDKINITKREYALLTLQYYEKKMNNWYEKFWVKENFISPDDIYVRLTSSPQQGDSFVLIFELTKPVLEIDSTLEVHKRISAMLTEDLQKKIRLDSTNWIQWMTAYTTDFNPSRDYKDVRSLVRSSKLNYIIPEQENLDELPTLSDEGRETLRIDSRTYAFTFLEPIIEDLHILYKQYLNFNGLELYSNAQIVMEKNKFNDDMITFLFKMDEKTLNSDPRLDVHRDMAKQLLSFVKRKVNPIQTRWLRFRFEADKTGKLADRVLLIE